MSLLSPNTSMGIDIRSIKNVAYPLLILLGAASLGAVVGLLEWKLAIIVLVGLIALPVIAFSFIRLDIGLLVMVAIGFFIEFFSKYVAAPFGTALDGLLILFSVSMIAGLAKTKEFSVFKHPVSYMVIIWMYYCIFEFFNPWTTSRLAWLFTVRSLAGLLFLYFIAVYALDSIKKIKFVIKVILALGFISALYGLKQEFFGFSDAEIAWLYQDEKRFQLIVQWSRMRVFSFFSEPTTCGTVLGYLAAMSTVLFFGPYKAWQKTLLAIAVLTLLAVVGFAGSRTPVVMFPAGIAFFVLLNPKKPILLLSLFFFTLGGFAMLKSSSNPVILRIQSAFRPTEDASMQVRFDSQKLIQPVIRKNPLGSGLGATGVWGRRFSPRHWLANFEPDSGLVRIAVEAGWIGLIIYLLFLFTIMVTGIRQYFRVKDPEIKNLTLAILVVMFCLIIASYPQEAIIMLPTSLIFYIFLACLVRMGKIDKALQDSVAQLETQTTERA